jgi:CRISPR-associated protein Csx17
VTKMHVHILRGCTPTPLAHYLKALGVLRLIARQADSSVRGLWKNGVFCLASSLDEESLVNFFLERYSPTPLLSPWNGGSGFYPGDNKDGFGVLRTSSAERFAPYRMAIAEAQKCAQGLDERPAGDEKALMLRRCVASWDDESYAWLRAAFTVDGVGEPRFPALLGTGGNDGRLDFTNNYMQRLVKLFDPESGAPSADGRAMVRLALFREVADGLRDNAIGQFYPGAAGGANATAGFDAGSLVNAWDFVLMLEGAVVMRVASLRRLDSSDLTNAAAPFALRSQGAGYASASPADASSRGEQWMPLWPGAATFAEVSSLFDEGRLHGGHDPARGTLEATRALAKLGVARGVSEFVRYGYFERNGLSNLAVPVGRLEVRHNPDVRALDELDGFVRSLNFAAGTKGAPLSLGRSQRRIEQAMLAAAFPNATAATWGELVSVLGEVEHGFLATPKSTKASNLRPLPRLSPKWLELIDDGSTEVRLAMAIASQSDAELGPLRVNALPLAPPKFFAFDTTAEGLVRDPSVVWQGHSLVADLTAIALRRVIDGIRGGVGHFPLQGMRFASLLDVRLFLEGRVDDVRISRLVRGLVSVNWAEVAPKLPSELGEPDALHALVRLTHLPRKLRSIVPRLDATPLRLLAAGRLQEATARLTSRLVASSLRPKIRVVAGDPAFAMRLGACVAIPISEPDLDRLLVRLTKPFVSKHQDVTA